MKSCFDRVSLALGSCSPCFPIAACFSDTCDAFSYIGRSRAPVTGIGDSRMPECYRFNSQDQDLIDAATVLLKEIVAFEKLCPAKLVSIAKLQHVLSRLPRVTPDLDVTISVIGPRHNFDEVET